MIIALISGGIVGAIPGILRAYLGTSGGYRDHHDELHCIVCVEMPLFMPFLKILCKSIDSTIRVSANATYQTPWLSELTGNSRMNIGNSSCNHCCLCDLVLLKKTTLGFEIRAVGLILMLQSTLVFQQTYNHPINDYLWCLGWSWWSCRRS